MKYAACRDYQSFFIKYQPFAIKVNILKWYTVCYFFILDDYSFYSKVSRYNPCSWNFIWAASWQNQQNGMCAQQRLRSAWASGQPGMPRLIWVYAGRTRCHVVGFVMRRLNYRSVSQAAIKPAKREMYKAKTQVSLHILHLCLVFAGRIWATSWENLF